MEDRWTLDNAVGIVRALQQDTRKFGFHLCLGGGVLNRGWSEKDVDLYFLPLDNPQYTTSYDELIKWLESMWGQATKIGDYSKKRTGNDEIRRNPRDIFFAPPELVPAELPVDPVPAQARWFEVPQQAGNSTGSITYTYGSSSSSMNVPLNYGPSEPKPPVYKQKLKFMRNGDERIDVFIL